MESAVPPIPGFGDVAVFERGRGGSPAKRHKSLTGAATKEILHCVSFQPIPWAEPARTWIMPDTPTADDRLQTQIQSVITLLNREKMVTDTAVGHNPHKRDLVESLTHRQHLAEVANRINALPPADIAHLLEMLPPDQRQAAWEQVDLDKAGDVLWEATDGVAETLARATSRDRLLAICRHIDDDDLAQIAEHVPEDVLQEHYLSLDPAAREWVKASVSYPEHSVGHIMNHDEIAVPLGSTVKDVVKMLRRLGSLPAQTNRLFVVDDRRRLKGALSVKSLLLHRPREPVANMMNTDPVRFGPLDKASAAARAFERYDLVSAPVVDDKGRLIGRLAVDGVMDFIREEAEDQALLREGLNPHEDLLGPIWKTARQRWLWLGLNLCTAFIASRVIGLFEGSIEQLVALATLMPIVASVGGNTGNQTIAIFIRGLALDQINASNMRHLMIKEVGVSVVNGLIWGSVMGIIAFALYQNPALGLVMAAATLLNLLVAAVVGIAVPVAMNKLGRDPALGSSVLLTFSTDSMGFFIFLGLATVFLLH